MERTSKLLLSQIQLESVESPEVHAFESWTRGRHIVWQAVGTSASFIPRAEAVKARLARTNGMEAEYFILMSLRLRGFED